MVLACIPYEMPAQTMPAEIEKRRLALKKVRASPAENPGWFAATVYGVAISAFDSPKQNPRTTSTKAKRPNSAGGKVRNNASEVRKFAADTLSGPTVATP